MSHRLEKANRIIQTSTSPGTSHGELIVKTLLEGRSLQELNVDELKTLAHGYNWWRHADKAYDAITLALKLEPANLALAEEAVVYILNAHRSSASRLEIYEHLAQQQPSIAWFWRIRKALEYQLTATGEMETERPEWEPGNEIPYPDALESAIDELLKTIVTNDTATLLEVRQHLDCSPVLSQSPRFNILKERLGFII